MEESWNILTSKGHTIFYIGTNAVFLPNNYGILSSLQPKEKHPAFKRSTGTVAYMRPKNVDHSSTSIQNREF